ncbi:hypothetical protein MHU86_22614 [Fragilaria crotonensis]|nr:hypothetical protein MHU86_22614 [Fragilaria crotonensis]
MIVSRGYVRLLIFLCCLLNLSQGSYLSEEITARLGQRNSYISDEDLDKCYAALYDADANGDRKIDGTEYVTVVQALGPDGFAENATSIEDLSRTLRLSFNLLACLCTINQTDQQCCIGDNAHINNEGTGPEETPDPDQEVYLRSVCLTTINAIDRTIGTSSPTTVAPSSPALPTSVPSKSPTSLSPTTPAPSTSTPVSLSPTTAQPITLSPTTVQPITSPPTTVQPITSPPTTVPPVTSSPTTVPPVTSSPTRVPPVTSSPTTTKPTTVPPTTLQPASLSPTTMQPISSPPTALPVTAVPISFGPTFIPPISFFPVSTVPTGPPVAPSSTTAPTAPAVPTAPTTASASPSNVVFPVVVEYEVAYRMGNSAGADADLNAAMDVLASQVAAETFPDPRGRRLIAQRRRLTVSVESTKVTGGFPAKACPSNLNSKDTCQTIVHSITLNIVDEDDTTVIKQDFLTQLNLAILEGRLQGSLDSVDANSNVFIVTGLAVPPTPSPTEAATGSLSSGQTIGIVIGALAGVGILVGAALLLKRRRDENKEGGDTYFPGAITASQTLSAAQDVEGDLGGDGTLGAGQADYRVKSKASAAALVEGEIADNAVPQDEKGADSSSNAGSSGWSSSVGNSTLNSESIDGMDEVTGSSLAAIGAASALAATSGSKDATGVPVVPEVTRRDLDLAIEAGDWAAVGATAALLAAASDSQSVSSRSRTSMSRGGSSISSLDAARAAELDHLVDAGDWEGWWLPPLNLSQPKINPLRSRLPPRRQEPEEGRRRFQAQVQR